AAAARPRPSRGRTPSTPRTKPGFSSPILLPDCAPRSRRKFSTRTVRRDLGGEGSLRVVPAFESFRRNAEKIAGEDPRVAKHLAQRAARAITRGRCERPFRADPHPTDPPQATHQIDVVAN